jgi:hypothetical protein
VPAGAVSDHVVEVTFDSGPLAGRQTVKRLVVVSPP